VVLAPSLVSVLWFGIFGGTALSLDSATTAALYTRVLGNEASALFLFLQHFPAAEALSVLAVLLVFIFLAAGADSGSYVLAMLVSHATSPSARLKVAWGVVLGVLSLAFVLGGDSIKAVRAMFTLGALPVLAILLGQVASLCCGGYRQPLADTPAERQTPLPIGSPAAGLENPAAGQPDSVEARP
jgi:glycine betaine transporter